jgi:hypothetical protein
LRMIKIINGTINNSFKINIICEKKTSFSANVVLCKCRSLQTSFNDKVVLCKRRFTKSENRREAF